MKQSEPLASHDAQSVQERVEAAVGALRAGDPAVIVDAGRRRGQGSLMVIGEHADVRAVARLMELGRGLVVLCMPPARFDELGLHVLEDMRNRGEGARGFGPPIQARGEGVSGVSAADRAAAIAAAIAPDATRDDLVTSGSVFPARAGERGVFSARRRIEAAVDLARLAGSPSATGVLCELLDRGHEVLTGEQLRSLADAEEIPLVTVDDVLKYRRLREAIIDPPVVVKLPTRHGAFDAAAYHDRATDATHVALWSDDAWLRAKPGSRLRSYVHEPCVTGDVLGGCAEGCGAKIATALEALGSGDVDVVVYLGSSERWRHLLKPGGDRAAAEDLDRYGVVQHIVADFAGGRSPRRGG